MASEKLFYHPDDHQSVFSFGPKALSPLLKRETVMVMREVTATSSGVPT